MINPIIGFVLDDLRKHIEEAEKFICSEIDKIRAEMSNLSRRVYELETKGRDE